MPPIKVSIIIPVYNAAPFIEECIKSVINQTYKDLEIIIINDCSTDNSMDIIHNIIPHNNINIVIIHHNENLGVSVARNTGIKMSTGDYLYFLDSDDFIYENCIQSFVSVLQEYPNVDIIIGSSNVRSTIGLQNDLKTPKTIKKMLLKHNYISIEAWNKLINKKFISTNQLSFFEGIIYEDILWNWDIASNIKSIAFNYQETYFYRNTPNSITHKYGIKEMDSEIIIIKKLVSKINVQSLSAQLINILHFSHTTYVRRFGNHEIPIIRYIKTFIFFIFSLLLPPQELRGNM